MMIQPVLKESFDNNRTYTNHYFKWVGEKDIAYLNFPQRSTGVMETIHVPASSTKHCGEGEVRGGVSGSGRAWRVRALLSANGANSQ
jgi:hypothetical protein